jgi:serine protease Do
MKALYQGRKAQVWVVGLAMLALAGWAVAAAGPRTTTTKGGEGKAPSPDTQRALDYANAMSNTFREAANRVLPQVVHISVSGEVAQRRESHGRDPGDLFEGTPFGDLFRNNPELRRFFKEVPSRPQQFTGNGSGIIIDPSGIILTNAHVVAGNGKIMVRLHDGREFPGTDVKRDERTDLAVLRIRGAGKLPAARLGDSDKVQVGDWVLALGEPFGLEGTVTAGIVSATSRTIGITHEGSLLQTDAAINPGNSGGPLVNLAGEVIGVNTAISSSSGGNQGVGFAIPVNLAHWVSEQLIAHGTVQRAYLGVMIQPVTAPLAAKFDVPVHQGVLVGQVQPQSPAAKAGLQAGDIITEFAGKKVTAPSDLQERVAASKIGSTQPMTILRNGERMDLKVDLQEQPSGYGMTTGEEGQEGGQEPSRFDQLGMQVEPLTADVAKQLQMTGQQGVVITDVQSGSPADRAGLTSGMVITQADRKPVKSPDDLRAVLSSKSLKDGVLLLVRDSHGARFVVVNPQE